MTKNWKDHLRNYAALQRAGAFIFTLVIIFIFLPKERLFKFEYQLNQPWKHEKLYAPFDFGIKKTAEELEVERASIQASQPPVFTYSKERTDQILKTAERNFSAQFPDSVARCDSAMVVALESYTQLLHHGLLERSHEKAQNIDPVDEVYISKNNQLETVLFHRALSIQEVLDTIAVVCARIEDSTCAATIEAALKQGIAPNALYDDSLTSRLLKNALSQVVEIEGKVEKGTALLDRGDIVNSEKYKILESLKQEYSQRVISDTGFQWSIVGALGVICLLIGLLILFVYMNQDRLFNDPRPMTLVLSLVSLSFVFSTLAIRSDAISIYAIPIGITPLLLRMFYDFRVSIFAFVISVLIVAIYAANPLEYLIIQIGAISFATLYQAASTKRSRMLATASIVFIGYSVIYTFVTIAQNGHWNGVNTELFGWFAINALLCMMVFPLVYLVEKVFGYVSETTLLELSDSNQPLLKELAIKAPGTFQHSLQVANLCEKVAQAIGGNGVLLRTAAMYHDVGKMNEPQFFIENQIPDNNPHDDLEPEESAKIIIDHVYKGIEMCRENRVPIEIIQFIQTHHGTSSVRFFLNKARKKAEATQVEVDPSIYSYPGPTPKTKEQAILMMADSVEAASRSLKSYDKASIDKLVDGLIDYQKSEGQFDDAPITLKDISTAKRTLKLALNGIFHQRISYD